VKLQFLSCITAVHRKVASEIFQGITTRVIKDDIYFAGRASISSALKAGLCAF
jgi:hypothetical protein